MKTRSQPYNTIVIGGSQAGLATGYCLKQQGRDFVILEANERVGDTWRSRWDSLRLFTPARLSGLPGLPLPAPPDDRPTKDEVANYLEAYAGHFELPVRTNARVDRLSKLGERYIILSGEQRYEADNVVIATGGYSAPRVPDFARDLNPNIRQLHSTEYQRPSQLKEGDVLVVGAANSGAEIALEVAPEHRTWLSGPHPGAEPMFPYGSLLDRLFTTVFWFIIENVVTVNNPIGRKIGPKILGKGLPLGHLMPDDLISAGVNRVFERTVSTQNGLPMLSDGRVLDVTNVVWCTGFQPDYQWIKLPIFDDKGRPQHERGVINSAPGLYFVGLLFQTAGTSSLVGGVGRDAAYIAEQIAARSRTAPVRAKAASPAEGKPNMAR